MEENKTNNYVVRFKVKNNDFNNAIRQIVYKDGVKHILDSTANNDAIDTKIIERVSKSLYEIEDLGNTPPLENG